LAGFRKYLAEHTVHDVVTLLGIAYRIGVIEQMMKFCMLVCRKLFVPRHRKIDVIWCNFKRFNTILNSEILLILIRKMKYVADQFQWCICFALATLNSSDVVETVTFEAETS